MDPNSVLTWIVAASSGVTLIRLLRLPPSPAYRRWIAVNLLLLGVVGVGLVIFPEYVGYLAVGPWFLFALVPGIASRFIQRWSLQQRYGRARRLSLIVGWLHPVKGWLKHLELLRALELASAGDLPTAQRILEQLRDDETLGLVAKVHLFRLGGQWEQALQWIDTTAEGKKIASEPSLLTFYLRVLGETGELSRLAKTYQESRRTLSPQWFTVFRSVCQLMVLSFFGKRQSVDKLLQGPLGSLPETHRQFWQATSDMASGSVESARGLLQEIRAKCDPVIQGAIDRRLSRPLAPATSFMAAAQEALNQIDQDILDEERFGERHDSRGRWQVTLALLAANLLGFAVEMWEGGATDDRVLYQLGALQASAVLQGEWWRVFFAQFLHLGAIHLVLNMVALVFVGRYLEFALGKARYLGVYFASGTGAMVVLVLTHMEGESQSQLFVGASGGILGLIGATAAVMLAGWRRERAPLARRGFVFVALILALQFVVDLSMPEVSFTAHISGAVIGLLVTLFLKHRLAPEGRLQPSPG